MLREFVGRRLAAFDPAAHVARRNGVKIRAGIEQSLREPAVRDPAAKFLLFLHREDSVLRLVQETTEPVGIPTLVALAIVLEPPWVWWRHACAT